jgi:hypothetical protein
VPSPEHLFLVQMLIPRIRSIGYHIVASDTYYFQLGQLRLRKPPAIARHQPDLVGIRRSSPRLAIGEAKIATDLRTRHTREQLFDYAKIPDAILIVAIPEAARLEYEILANEIGLSNLPNVSCLLVPRELMRNAET